MLVAQEHHYSFGRFGLHNLLPSVRRDKSRTLYDYKEKKKRERGEYRPYTLTVGLCFLLVGLLLSLIYLLI